MEPLWPLGGQARLDMWGPVTWEVHPDGSTITMDPEWERRWLVEVELPELGGRRVVIHRAFVQPLRAWLRDGIAEGLLTPATPLQITRVPRLARRRGVSRPWPSAHSYGVALDLDPATYPEGSRGDGRVRRLAEIAARHGMGWGGLFADPDPMHFELVRRSDV